MKRVDSTATDFSRIWGPAPTTLDLIAFAASMSPQTVALDGANGGLTFQALHAQASATATVLAAQGIDTDAAVGAAITGALGVVGLAPDEVA